MNQFQPKLKMFGAAADRVTSEEVALVFQEIRDLVGSTFAYMDLTIPLADKPDHGDIDILVVPSVDIKNILKDNILNYNNNGDTKSILFKSKSINKTVHVDFISSETEEEQKTKLNYYSLNDFSFAAGIVAKNLHFKYGSNGFFKIYIDKKGTFRYIHITNNLDDGLKILGYDPVKKKLIKDNNGIVDFLKGSSLFDSSYFGGAGYKADDRQAVKARPGCRYISELLSLSGVARENQDEDFFLKSLFPEKYDFVKEEEEKIESYVHKKDKYNGGWVMYHFGLPPGKKLGSVLKAIKEKFNEQDVEEEEMKRFVKSLL